MSQSLRADQGNSDSILDAFLIFKGPKSQSLRADQGNSDNKTSRRVASSLD